MNRKGMGNYAKLFIIPALAYMFLWNLFPSLFTAYLSFNRWNLLRSPWPSFIGIENYAWLIGDPAFWTSLSVTLKFVFLTTSAQFILGMGLAVFVDRELRGSRFIKGFSLLPLTITPVVVGTIWYILLSKEIGPITYFTGLLGLKSIDWLNSPGMALLSVAISDIWQWTPFMFLLLLAGLQGIPVQLYEAARVDGATGLHIFIFITLPQLRVVIFSAILLRSIQAWKEIGKILLMTGGGPGNSTEVLNLFVYRKAFQYYNMGEASAAVIITLCIMGIIYGIYLKVTKL